MYQSADNETVGMIHSFETLGTLDGPGLRTVVFMQGCPLRCKFCHNVDAAIQKGGEEYTVEALAEKLLRNRVYWEAYSETSQVADAGVPGGITISGGDPVYQPQFLIALAKKIKSEGVHLAIDTSLATTRPVIDALLPLVDLWMISLKQFDEEAHLALTSVSNKGIMENIRYLDEQISQQTLPQSPQIRHRFVVIPGMTDSDKVIAQLGEFVSQRSNLEMLELLPYGAHGKFKWVELFGKYSLEDIREAEQADLERVAERLARYKLPLKY